jgi:hypothetical protein
MRLEMREWEASRSRTESPWSASRRRLSESRVDAARARRSSTEAGLGAGKGDAGAERGDLVLGVAGEEGARKPRPAATATGDGDASSLVADGDEVPEEPGRRGREGAPWLCAEAWCVLARLVVGA